MYNEYAVSNVLIILSLIALFSALGKAADMVVVNVQQIAERLNAHVFFLGIILGLLTSLPEFSIGINTLVTDTNNVSLGNLLGGIITLFSLVLGGSIILNRKIRTDGKTASILPALIFLLLPIIFSADGIISFIDGIVIVVAYFALVYHLYEQHREHHFEKRVPISRAEFIKKWLFVAGGTTFVILISNLIVKLSLTLTNRFNVPQFIVGVLFFAIGTNLPEITITVHSWKHHIRELSLSNLIGSALANALMIGIFAFIKPFRITSPISFMITSAFMFLVLALFSHFYKTDRALTKYEGVTLVALYLFFVILQVALFV